jgi:hypothetical protein
VSAARCSCGTARDHVIAWRRTADGREVLLHSTGAVTGATGAVLSGVPVARPRTAEARARDLAAGWLVVGEVELYAAAEVGMLYDVARKLVTSRPDATPGDLRAAFAAAEEGAQLDRIARSIRWEHVSGDLYAGRLPRLRWPHTAVTREGGRYDVCVIVSRLGAGSWVGEVAEPTGHSFTNLRDLARHLRDEGRRAS